MSRSPHDKDSVVLAIHTHKADVKLHEFCCMVVPNKDYEFVALRSYETVIVPRIHLLSSTRRTWKR